MNMLVSYLQQLCESKAQIATEWNVSKDGWDDMARLRFEEKFWSEIDATTEDSIGKLQDLITLIDQARSEVA
jgi:hypothetical protein